MQVSFRIAVRTAFLKLLVLARSKVPHAPPPNVAVASLSPRPYGKKSPLPTEEDVAIVAADLFFTLITRYIEAKADSTSERT